MSEEAVGGFLTRWSRRKAASRQAAPPETPELTQDVPVLELPPIESLGADSDYTAFLARGVSQAVQAEALRIAWTSDPAIANFRGMAEYAWDFNAPGYGDLAPGDDAAVWLSQIVRSGARVLATTIADASGLLGEESNLSAVSVSLAPPMPTELPSLDSSGEQPVSMIASDAPFPAAPNFDAPKPDVPDLNVPKFNAQTLNVPVAVSRRHGGAMPV